MQCPLEGGCMCSRREAKSPAVGGGAEWTQQVMERSPNWVVQKAAVSDEDSFSSASVKEHVKMERGKKKPHSSFASYSAVWAIQPLNCVLKHLNNPKFP